MLSSWPLSQLTSQFLDSAEGQEFLPELTSLKSVFETNSGHIHQSVFDHTVAVMAGMEKVIKGEFLSATYQLKLAGYLSQKIDQTSKSDLLKLVVLVHDLTKGMALVTRADGSTSCPGHEVLAAAKVADFTDRFNLSQAEIDQTQQIVRLHGSPHELLALGLTQPVNQLKIIRQYNLATAGLGMELILMVYADILGGNLNQINLPEFTARTSLCQTWLTQLVQDLA